LIASTAFADELAIKIKLTTDMKYAVGGTSNGPRVFSIYLEEILHINHFSITTEEGREIKHRRHDTDYKVG
jgi:hypothetical protein